MKHGYPKDQLLKLISQLKKFDENKDGMIDQQEWNNFVNEKLKPNFVERHPYTQIIIPGYYTLDPPPVFIIGICLVQMIFYMLRCSFCIIKVCILSNIFCYGILDLESFSLLCKKRSW